MEKNVKKIKMTIDGNEVLVSDGATILEAAQQNGIYIPTLCHHPALTSWGGCRICVVEVDKSPKLAASCVMPVREGMEVVTTNPTIIESRRMVLEFLFAERNHNCMFCPQSGDCELQKLAYELQMDHLTVSFSFRQFPTDATNEYMTLDHNRCILCGRCVRACREIAGAYVLNYQNRGPQTLIGFDLNQPRERSSCDKSGVCMQVCPTGAIYNRYRAHYAVMGHRKDWQEIESLCPQCGSLCPATYSVKDNSILKIDGCLLSNGDRPDRGQLCYKGRFEVFKTGEERLLRPMVRTKEGGWEDVSWEQVLDLVTTKLTAVRDTYGAGSLLGLASGACSNEELMLFRDLMMKGWGVDCVDSLDGAHYRTVSAVRGEVGDTLRESSWKAIPDTDFVMVVGGDAYRTQPLVSALMHRTVIEKGLKVAVIGRKDFLAPYSSYYLPIRRSGDMGPFMKALVEELGNYTKAVRELAEGIDLYDESYGISSSDRLHLKLLKFLSTIGFDGAAIKAFFKVVQSYAKSTNPLLVVGEEVIGLDDPSGLKYVVELAKEKGQFPDGTSRMIFLKQDGNSSGAWKLGLSSKTGPTGAALKGGLVLLGGEAVDAGRPDDLAGIEFLAVLSPFKSKPWTDKAHVLIPKPLWMEEDGSYTSLDGREIAYKRKVLAPPQGVKDSWQTLWALVERTQFRPSFSDWDGLCATVKQEMRSEVR
jgi:formate dehydrogenase major subunit